jgi:amino-acid N-acetyltransferase
MNGPQQYSTAPMQIRIECARGEDLATVRAFLDAARLPSSDLTADHLQHFCVARMQHLNPGAEARQSVMSLQPTIDGSCRMHADLSLNDDMAGEAVGSVGLEARGSAALLRSLAVASDQRGKRIGHALVGAIESRARSSRIGELFLLTTSAEHFFARLDYAVISRDDVPAALRETPEFSSLCPASAICMRKRLSV